MHSLDYLKKRIKSVKSTQKIPHENGGSEIRKAQESRKRQTIQSKNAKYNIELNKFHK